MTDKKTLRLLTLGRDFAAFLPDYRLLGVDPGLLFVSNRPDGRQSLDLPEEVVQCLLYQLSKND